MTTPTVHYDAESNAAYIRFSQSPVHESDEVAPGLVLDYDQAGHIVWVWKSTMPASSFPRICWPRPPEKSRR